MVIRSPYGSLFPWLAGCVVASLLVFTPLGEAAELEGVTFVDSYQAGSITMPLHGDWRRE